tara:strand:+ start:52 stop:252 length:201 start_codon:yes stop_codon:yes gene_type:complete
MKNYRSKSKITRHLFIGEEWSDTNGDPMKVVKIEPAKRGTPEFPATRLTFDNGTQLWDGEQWGVTS